ncbi:hypothetical protein HPB47_009909 [Ixodes persulcatus]|uniref:Uncharacterized protein n=1 Tax=Ixodes persulcatus TaxID=34615 RepID=A0AC60P0V7_IXOPE|nr:hypothetical protein HPB47_009909 [Ixodes persulcatus]
MDEEEAERAAAPAETAVMQPKGTVDATGAGPAVVNASSPKQPSTAVLVLTPAVAHQSATPPENEVGATPVPEEGSTGKEMDVEAGTAKHPLEDVTEASQERRLRQLERKWRMVAGWKGVDSQPRTSSPKGREKLSQ